MYNKEYQFSTNSLLLNRNKELYAAYLNTAQQNVFIILKDLSTILGYKFINDDTKMLQNVIFKELKSNKFPEKVSQIIDGLQVRFGFLRLLAYKESRNRLKRNDAFPEPIDYYVVLTAWISYLTDLRNFCSHANHVEIPLPSNVLYGMWLLYDSDWKNFKTVNNYTDEEVSHLLRRSEKGERLDFNYKFVCTDNKLTEIGFLYFLCLWLSDKDSVEVLKKHKGFKGGRSKAHQATIKLFTRYKIKLPKTRLQSVVSEDSLFLDMVSELQRCPDILYKLLRYEDQLKFRPNNQFDINDQTDEIEHITLLTRKKNRFYYFALRFLDSSFRELKFQIDLGNYCYKTYEQMMEGENRKRRWVKRLTAFGNLYDFLDVCRPDVWHRNMLNLDDVSRPEKYFTDTTPHYHMGNVNTIGMRFMPNYKRESIWPQITDNNGNLIAEPRNVAPEFWLSLYELPFVVFYELLRLEGKTKYSAEDIIRIYRNRYIAFISKIDDGSLQPPMSKEAIVKVLSNFEIKISDIPQSIVNYLLQKPTRDFNKIAEQRLAEMLIETENLIRRVERQSDSFAKKVGSKDYIPMRNGQIADYLARDLILLQKPSIDDKGKANATEFQLLQSKLAFFSANISTLSETFKLCKLIESNNQHPFLFKIDLKLCKGLVDFYKKYLKLKREYLQDCVNKKDYFDCHFLKLRRESIPFKELIKRQGQSVMNLPRGLFKDKILKVLSNNHETSSLINDLQQHNRLNATFIIKSYFEQCLDDNSQQFYSFLRSYEILNKMFDDRMTNSKIKLRKSYYSPEQLSQSKQLFDDKLSNFLTSLSNGKRNVQKDSEVTPFEEKTVKINKQFNAFKENEKQIRLYETCDRVLFMVIRHYRHKLTASYSHPLSSSVPDEFKLEGIMPASDQGFLSKGIELRFPYRNVKDKQHSIEPEKIVVCTGMKPKDYGNFRIIMVDRRIHGLFQYLDLREIRFEAIQLELMWFDKYRIEVIHKVLELEKKFIVAQNKELGNKKYLNHREDILELIPELDTNEVLRLNELRKMVFHSQYPNIELFQSDVDSSKFNNLFNYNRNSTDILNQSIFVQLKNLAIREYTHAISLI